MNAIRQTKKDRAANATLVNICLTRCRKLVAQIEETKDAILAQFREKFEANEHLLRLALNEAEAIAWETEFPPSCLPDARDGESSGRRHLDRTATIHDSAASVRTLCA